MSCDMALVSATCVALRSLEPCMRAASGLSARFCTARVIAARRPVGSLSTGRYPIHHWLHCAHQPESDSTVWFGRERATPRPGHSQTGRLLPCQPKPTFKSGQLVDIERVLAVDPARRPTWRRVHLVQHERVLAEWRMLALPERRSQLLGRHVHSACEVIP